MEDIISFSHMNIALRILFFYNHVKVPCLGEDGVVRPSYPTPSADEVVPPPTPPPTRVEPAPIPVYVPVPVPIPVPFPVPLPVPQPVPGKELSFIGLSTEALVVF
jgi:hypothetical protein